MNALFMSPAAALLAKVTLVLAVGLFVASRIRSTAPELRHLLLFSALASALVLPITLVALPRWDAPLLPSREQPVIAMAWSGANVAAISSAVAYTEQEQVPLFARDDNQSLAELVRAHPAATLALLWLAGSGFALLMLLAGYVRLDRITRRAWPLALDEWGSLLDDERARACVTSDVDLLVSPVASTPLTWGTRRAVILLPEDALQWPAEHRRVVLRHELAHIARRDAMAQLVAGVACGVYWFHPLVWIAARRLRAECERACDDRVLSSGTPAADYASHLLEVARSTRSLGGPGFLSVAMARPSQLEGRLLAILDEGRRTTLTRRARFLAVTCSAVIVLVVSGFRAVPRTPSTPISAAVAQLVTTPASPHVAATARSALAVATPISRADTTFEKSVDVRSGETLTLDLTPTGGALTITGWDEPRVRVRGTLAGRGWHGTQVKLESDNGGALLKTTFLGHSGDQSFSHRFEINVPRKFNVRVKSSGGSITIANVEGTFRGGTGGGSIDIARASGDVRLTTGGGDVRVSDSDLSGTVSTGGGGVQLSNVSGGLRGSSGSGDVTIHGSGPAEGSNLEPISKRNLDGAVASGGYGSNAALSADDIRELGRATRGARQYRSGGDIVLGDAPNGARVSTGGGAISIGRAGGDVYATTGGGRISIGSAEGSVVVAETGAGDVEVTFTGSGARSGELTTGYGHVTLTLPRDANTTLILETAYTNGSKDKTRIESDWPLTVTESPDWETGQGTPRKYVRSRLVLGTGEGVIRVRAINGNVVVKRAP